MLLKNAFRKLSHFLSIILISSFFLLVPSRTAAAAPLNYAVIADFSRSTFTSAFLQSAIEAYVSNTSSSLTLFQDAVPHIINSNGSLLTALTQLDLAAKSTPEGLKMIFIGDTSSITEGVSDFIFHNSSQTPIISLMAASDSYCANYPQVLCICPAESSVVRGLLEISYSQFSWEGASAAMLDTVAGHRLGDELADQNALYLSPSITRYYYVSQTGSDFSIPFNTKEIGIFTFLPDSEMLSLYANYINTSSTGRSSGNSSVTVVNITNSSSNHTSTPTNTTSSSSCSFFFIGNYLSLNAREQFPGGGACAALFVPHYASLTQLQTQGIIATNVTNSGNVTILDDTGAFVVSYLFDAMQMVQRAGGSLNVSDFRGLNFTGFTGQVMFDRVTFQRLGVSIDLISATYDIESPLISYTLLGSGASTIQNLKPAIVSSWIPSSTLSTATVCLAIPPSCEDISQAVSVYYYLLYQYFVDPNISFSLNVKFIDTGNEGVSGYTSFLSIARLCTAVLGTGHASIDYALAPLINYFDITQIDYQAATSEFSGSHHQTIPSFSRSIPEYSYSDQGFAEICTHFGWERIIVLSTSDRYGEARGRQAVAAMVRRNVYVEKEYHLTSTSQEAVLSVFQKIYSSDVSRILLIAASFTSDEAKAFFNLIDQAPYLNNYVLLLDQTLCAYGNAYPSARNKLQSSICMAPEVSDIEIEALNDYIRANNLPLKASNLLTSGGFQTEASTCSYNNVSAYNGFAIDAGAVFFQAVSNANSEGVSWLNSSAILPFIRNQIFFGITTTFTIDAKGNRDSASYNCNVQTTNEKVVTFGSWSEDQKPSFQSLDVAKWVWMDNSTVVPLDTFRDAVFVFQSTAFSSPEGIAISAIGFILTIFAFFLCFRHYDIQHKIDRTLASNKIPVTDTELKQLRALRE